MKQTVLFFEDWHLQIFECDPDVVMNAEYQFNKLYEEKSYATLNDFYYLLGFPLIEDGDNVGWHDFDSFGPCRIGFIHNIVSISSETNPEELYVIKITYNPEPIRFEHSIQEYRRNYYGRKEQ